MYIQFFIELEFFKVILNLTHSKLALDTPLYPQTDSPTIFPVTADNTFIFSITQAKILESTLAPHFLSPHIQFFSKFCPFYLQYLITFGQATISSRLDYCATPSCVSACFYLSSTEEPNLTQIMSLFSPIPFHFPQNKSPYNDLWSIICPLNAKKPMNIQLTLWPDLPQFSSSLSSSYIRLLDCSQTYLKSNRYTNHSPIRCLHLLFPLPRIFFPIHLHKHLHHLFQVSVSITKIFCLK